MNSPSTSMIPDELKSGNVLGTKKKRIMKINANIVPYKKDKTPKKIRKITKKIRNIRLTKNELNVNVDDENKVKEAITETASLTVNQKDDENTSTDLIDFSTSIHREGSKESSFDDKEKEKDQPMSKPLPDIKQHSDTESKAVDDANMKLSLSKPSTSLKQEKGSQSSSTVHLSLPATCNYSRKENKSVDDATMTLSLSKPNTSLKQEKGSQSSGSVIESLPDIKKHSDPESKAVVDTTMKSSISKPSSFSEQEKVSQSSSTVHLSLPATCSYSWNIDPFLDSFYSFHL